MKSHKLIKIHNLGDLRPYYNSFERLYTFMHTVAITDDVAFKDNVWNFARDKTFHFRFDKKKENDFLSKEEMKPLKFVFKFLYFLYISGITEKETVLRTGNQALFSSMKPMIKFLGSNNIFVRNEDNKMEDSKYIDIHLINDFIETLKESNNKNATNRNYLMAFYTWHSISSSLPSFLQIYNDPINGKVVNQIFVTGADETPWEPIDEKGMQLIIKSSIDYIEKNSKIILTILKHVTPMQKIDFSKEDFNFKGNIYSTKTNSIRAIFIDAVTEIDYDIDINSPLNKIALTVKKWLNKEIPKYEFVKEAKYNLFWTSFRILVGALSSLIFISTGMRRSEFNNLEKGCILSDEHTEVPLMQVTIDKTSRYVEGDTDTIPVPDFVVKAVSILEQIGDIVYPTNKKLFFNYRASEESEVYTFDYHSVDLIASYHRSFFDYINLGYYPSPHRFRKTIAWYFMIGSAQAAMLLKRLFKHKSIKMVLHYMMIHPLLRRELEEISNSHNASIAEEVSKGVISGQISGDKGKRILKAISNSRFKGMTGNELQQTISQFLLYQVQNKQNFLFATPLCVCVRSASAIEKSPCMLTNDLNDPVMGMIPRPSNCDGLSCKDAIFLSSKQEGLENKYKIYKSVLDNIKQLPDEQKSQIFVLDIQKKIKRIENIFTDIGVVYEQK